jgi:ABC-type multidrug transport system fused ATPase/permease subunit
MQKLAPSYRFNTDKDRSQLLTILTANVAAVVTFLTTSTILFSAPATLIGVQVFLFIKVGIYGFVLIVILAIAGVVQAILHKKILSAKR